MAHDTKYGDVEIPGIPEDEPVFILRAKDAAALIVLEDYYEAAEEVGASTEFLKSILDVEATFGDWQNDNADKVKVPD